LDKRVQAHPQNSGGKMKKLIALSMAFALVATAAFAQIGVGGSVVGEWSIINVDGDDVTTNPGDMAKHALNGVRARVNVNGIINEEGTLGGMVQLRPMESYQALTNVWWQPASFVKFTLGYFWGGGGQGVGVANVADDIIPVKMYGRDGWKGDNTRGALNGWGYEVLNGSSIELFPVEGLYIAATVPTGDALGGAKAADIFARTMGRVAYTINGIGQIAVTYGGGTTKIAVDQKGPRASVKFFDLRSVGPQDPSSPASPYDYASFDEWYAVQFGFTPDKWDTLTSAEQKKATEDYNKAMDEYYGEKWDDLIPEWDLTKYYADVQTLIKGRIGDAFSNGDSARIAAGFTLTAIENLGVYVGFEYPMASTFSGAFDVGHRAVPNTSTTADPMDTRAYVNPTFTATYQPAMEGKLRVSYAAGAFNFASGVLLKFGEKTTVTTAYGEDVDNDVTTSRHYKVDADNDPVSVLAGTQSVTVEKPMTLGVTLNPSYALDIMTVGLVGELNVTLADTATVDFNIVPYVQKPLGGGAVWAGVQIEGSTAADSNVKFAIPVGFEYWF
jgi:hypothetical protein